MGLVQALTSELFLMVRVKISVSCMNKSYYVLHTLDFNYVTSSQSNRGSITAAVLVPAFSPMFSETGSSELTFNVCSVDGRGPG